MELGREVRQGLGVLSFWEQNATLQLDPSQGQVSDLPSLRFYILAMAKDAHLTGAVLVHTLLLISPGKDQFAELFIFPLGFLRTGFSTSKSDVLIHQAIHQ